MRASEINSGRARVRGAAWGPASAVLALVACAAAATPRSDVSIAAPVGAAAQGAGGDTVAIVEAVADRINEDSARATPMHPTTRYVNVADTSRMPRAFTSPFIARLVSAPSGPGAPASGPVQRSAVGFDLPRIWPDSAVILVHVRTYGPASATETGTSGTFADETYRYVLRRASSAGWRVVNRMPVRSAHGSYETRPDP